MIKDSKLGTVERDERDRKRVRERKRQKETEIEREAERNRVRQRESGEDSTAVKLWWRVQIPLALTLIRLQGEGVSVCTEYHVHTRSIKPSTSLQALLVTRLAPPLGHMLQGMGQ